MPVFMVATLVQAQNKLTGIVVDETQESLTGVTVLLYAVEDSIIPVKSTQTNIFGQFVLENMQKGDYTVKFSMIGMITRQLPVSIISQNVDLGMIDMLEADNVLGEVTIKGKMPETKIVNLWLSSLSEISELTTVDERVIPQIRRINNVDYDLHRYEGLWQWKSIDEDTVFTVRFIDATIQYSSASRDGNRRLITSRQSRIIRNKLYGEYELTIRDSVIFSNLYSKADFNNPYFMSGGYDNIDIRFMFLSGLRDQSSRNKAYLALWKNPLGKSRGFITFQLINEKQGIGFWKVQVLKRGRILSENGKSIGEEVTVREVIPGDFIFPDKVLMRRIKK